MNATRHCLLILLISAALATPCLWQPRIQAGDFSSHLYNAWLVEQIGRGQLSGLTVVSPWTNVLFDLLLSRLLAVAGLHAAQRIAMSMLVLNFFWAAFVLVCVVTGRRPWFLAPCLAMLAYGLIFHAGFCNFLLATGLSLWAVALLWRPTLSRWLAASLLLLLAAAAHALPVAMALAAAGYVQLARKTPRRRHPVLLAGTLALLLLLSLFLRAQFETSWAPQQAIGMTGADQVWLFGPKYRIVAAALFFLWSALFLWRTPGPLFSIPLQLYLLAAALVVLIPVRVFIPGFAHALVYISDRMSLAAAVAACLTVGTARPSWFEKAGLALLAGIFFTFLYADTRVLNGIEDQMAQAVRQVPPGSRVVHALAAPTGRLDPLTHMLERVCIGRCFSYANYEPSTAQFRVRAAPDNGIVLADYGDVFALRSGAYVVRERDLPLFLIDLCGATNLTLCVRSLSAGQTSPRTLVRAIPSLLSR